MQKDMALLKQPPRRRRCGNRQLRRRRAATHGPRRRRRCMKINPRLVVVTMPAFGMTGPWSGVRAYGSTLEQASGPAIGHRPRRRCTDHAARRPRRSLRRCQRRRGPDARLRRIRSRTGQGQHIDLSATEALLPLGGALDHRAIRDRKDRARGSATGTPALSPTAAFPCLGEDQWVTHRRCAERQRNGRPCAK